MLLHWCFPIAGKKGLACQNAELCAPSLSILMILFDSTVRQKVRAEINIIVEAKSSRECAEIVLGDNCHSTFVFHSGLFEHWLKFWACSWAVPSLPPHHTPPFSFFYLHVVWFLSSCPLNIPGQSQTTSQLVAFGVEQMTFVTASFVFVFFLGSLWK